MTLYRLMPGLYSAWSQVAGHEIYSDDGEYIVDDPGLTQVHGRTPTAALRALIAELRKR